MLLPIVDLSILLFTSRIRNGQLRNASGQHFTQMCLYWPCVLMSVAGWSGSTQTTSIRTAHCLQQQGTSSIRGLFKQMTSSHRHVNRCHVLVLMFTPADSVWPACREMPDMNWELKMEALRAVELAQCSDVVKACLEICMACTQLCIRSACWH